MLLAGGEPFIPGYDLHCFFLSILLEEIRCCDAGRADGADEKSHRVDEASRAHDEPRQRCVRAVGLRTARTLPLVAPPQKNRSLPSASSPLTVMPAGISRRTRTSPFSGSTRRISLLSASIVACQSSTSSWRTSSPLAGSMAASFSPLANQMLRPSQVTPWTWSMPGNGPYSRTISARFAVLGLVVVFMAGSGLTHRQRPWEQQGCRESGERRRDPAARAPATDRTHRPGFVEVEKGPLHRPLARAEGVRERGGGPGLAP